MNESGLPYEVDPVTLETMGLTRLDGAIERGPFHAHVRVREEPEGKRLVTFGAEVKGVDADVIFYEFDDQGNLWSKTSHVIPSGGLGFYHDMVVTENYYGIIENPTRFDVWKMVTEMTFGKCSLAECISFDRSKSTKVHLIPRPGKAAATKPPCCAEIPACFTFHHINAYEIPGTDKVVFDTVMLPEISFSTNLTNLAPEYYENGKSRSDYRRIVIDLPRQTATVSPPFAGRAIEFPSVAPHVVGSSHRSTYCGASAIVDPDHRAWGPNQAWARIDLDPLAGVDGPIRSNQVKVDAWVAEPNSFVMEPIFVPKSTSSSSPSSSETDGYVVGILHNADTKKAELCVLDAGNMAAGPLCRIRLPHHIPSNLHGSWVPECLPLPTIRGEDDAPVTPGQVHIVNRIRT